MHNQWGNGGVDYPHVGQPNPQAYGFEQVGLQMNSQTHWNGESVLPALNASYSRRYIKYAK